MRAAQTWLSGGLESEAEALCAALRSFSGHRSVWLDPDGTLWHAEPEDMLEEDGHAYVGTFLNPSPDVVAQALSAHVS